MIIYKKSAILFLLFIVPAPGIEVLMTIGNLPNVYLE
mgnify:CR=1 FL=1|jgi:hypothetical protein